MEDLVPLHLRDPTTLAIRGHAQEPAQLALQLAELERQLAMRNKKLFGRSSEKRAHSKQDDMVPAEPQRGHGPNDQTELSEFEQVHDLDEADRACKQCGEPARQSHCVHGLDVEGATRVC